MRGCIADQTSRHTGADFTSKTWQQNVKKSLRQSLVQYEHTTPQAPATAQSLVSLPVLEALPIAWGHHQDAPALVSQRAHLVNEAFTLAKELFGRGEQVADALILSERNNHASGTRRSQNRYGQRLESPAVRSLPAVCQHPRVDRDDGDRVGQAQRRRIEGHETQRARSRPIVAAKPSLP